MIEAEATTIVLIVIAVGALSASVVLARRAARVGPGGTPEFDNSLATFASRNAKLPYLIGRQKLPATVVSVWNRIVEQQTEGSSGSGGKDGGGGGGSATTTTTVYYEDAVHYLALGPGSRLRKIIQSGQVIWEGVAGPDADGIYQEDLGEEGAFIAYFGRDDNLKSLQRNLDGSPASVNKAKHIIAVRWIKKRLGGTPTWPQIEYEWDAYCPENALPGSAYLVKPSSGEDDYDYGVNIVHALFQILFAPWPHGVGLPLTMMDETSWIESGYIAEQEGLAVNMLIREESAEDIVKELLNLMGAFLLDEAGVFILKMVREQSDDIADITSELQTPPDSEVDVNLSETAPSRIIPSFPDIRNNFRNNGALSLDDDGRAIDWASYRVETLTTGFVTSQHVMDVVLRRKMPEYFGDRQAISLVTNRGTHIIPPGNVVSVEGLGTVRVMESTFDPMDMTTRLGVVVDSFGIPDTDEGSDPGGDETSGDLGVQADIYVRWYEVPASESLGVIRFVVFRIRAHRQIVGADIIADVSGNGYLEASRQDKAAAGGPHA